MKGILLGDDLDLVIENGTVAIGESAQQEMVIMMLCEKGEIKHDPACGLGLLKWGKGQRSLDNIESEIRSQAEYCQIRISDIQLDQILKVYV